MAQAIKNTGFPGAGESYFKKGTIKCNTVDRLPSLFQILGDDSSYNRLFHGFFQLFTWTG